MSALVIAVIAIAIALSGAIGVYTGIEWQQGREAIKQQELQDKLDEAQAGANKIALIYAENSAKLNSQIGDARVQIRSLTRGTKCLDSSAVGVLNGIATDVPAAPSQPASAPSAFATDQDVGDAYAVCAGAYRKLSDQLNAIIDLQPK